MRCNAFMNNKETGVLIRNGNNAVKLKKATSANLAVITLVRALIVLRHLINTSFNNRNWNSGDMVLDTLNSPENMNHWSSFANFLCMFFFLLAFIIGHGSCLLIYFEVLKIIQNQLRLTVTSGVHSVKTPVIRAGSSRPGCPGLCLDR